MTLTPSWIPGFALTVDYFNIGISSVIGTISPNLALTQCVATGNSTYCSLVHRAPGTGALFSDVNGYIIATTVNLGSLSTSGIDFQADYAIDLNEWTGSDLGNLTFGLFGTYLTKYHVRPIDGLGSYDCDGLFGPVCGQSVSVWRHQLHLNWDTPWYGVNVGLAWRHAAATDLEKTSSNTFLKGVVPATDARIGSTDFFDATLSAPVTSDVTLRVGVNNVFDRDPPLIGSTNTVGSPGALNTYPMYDVMGRYMFVSLSAKM
jgi:outer membrane receptor protein involved in Fe transport